MVQGPSDTILVAIRITLRIRESKVRNPDPPDRQRFVLSEHRFLVNNVYKLQTIASLDYMQVHRPVLSEQYLPILVTIYTNT